MALITRSNLSSSSKGQPFQGRKLPGQGSAPKGSALSKIMTVMSTYLNKYEDDFQVEEQNPERYYFLRPSSFPYCGFRKLLNAVWEVDAPRLNTFASTYFTEVGHTTHAVFQLFGGRGGKLVGDWECKTCGKWTKFSTNHMCDCGCDKGMKYHELEVKYKDIVIGHIDGLFRLDPSKGKKSIHVLVDYKTTSKSKIGLSVKASPFPYKYNVSQIEAYVPLVEIQYGVTIDYWLLIYLARDAPFKYGRELRGAQMSLEDKEKILRRLNRWVKTHLLVLEAKTREDFELIEQRKLCKSKEDYNKCYKEEYNECPFADKCFTDSSTLINKALTRRVYPILDNAPKRVRRLIREQHE